jgi:hypothetical protein
MPAPASASSARPTALEDLYGARYVEAVTAAAQALVKDRLLLPEDAER